MKYILPGMGADSDMYSGPWRRMEDCLFLNWPKHNGEATLSGIAERILNEYPIDSNDILIGSSLGGMVCLEISRIAGCEKIFLIGSAVKNGELRMVSKLLLYLASRNLVRLTQIGASLFSSPVLQMYTKADAGFIAAMSSALLHWKGFERGGTGILRIHGGRDRLIRCTSNAELVPSAGHLIAITHAPLCVDFVRRNS